MKNPILFLSILFFWGYADAQVKIDDFGRIILNSYLPENTSIPDEAKSALINKLNQITTNNGVGGSQANPRFIISVSLNVGTKDIVAGPPQMIAQKIDLTLYVGDAINNTVFSSFTIGIKGVGTNENKALIDAFKNLNTKNKEIQKFLEEGKKKIIEYYNTNCDFIIKEAQALVKLGEYDEAIYRLSVVPDVCHDCYFQCLDTLESIYQQKIDSDCRVKLKEARVIWTTAQNPIGAEKTGDILSTISPMAKCQTEVTALINSIDNKLKTDEKSRWQLKMKLYADKIAGQKEQLRIAEEQLKRDDVFRENEAKRDAELEKIQVMNYRIIALEYINQKK